MAKKSLNPGGVLARLVKAAMVVLLLPAVIGMLDATARHLDAIALHSRMAGYWVNWGFLSYVGVHLILVRPRPIFHASHRIFAVVAAWLFGGHVTSVEDGTGPTGAKRRKSSTADDETVSTAAGSPLVAFSPYVIPFYTILICGIAALARRWIEQPLIEVPAAFLVGLTMAFHWIMTADDLQEQRDQWHIETYLLAISLVFLLTLVLTLICLPWAIPQVSFSAVMSDGAARSQAIYDALFGQLFR